MSPLKQIIITHYTLPPVVGGVESILSSQAKLFASKGYHVTLLAGEGKIEESNIKTSIIPELSPYNPHIRSFQRIMKLGSLPESYELRLKNLSRKIEAYVGDINNIIIHNIMTMPFNLTATEAFRNFIEQHPDKHFYIWTHDIAWIMDDHKNYVYERKPWSIMKTAIPNVTYIAISDLRRRQMSEVFNLPKKKILVVPNTIKYQDFFKFDVSTSKIISEIQPFQRYPIILLPARLIPRKNLERGLGIIQSLLGHFPNLLALITGIPDDMNFDSENYAKELKKSVEDNNLNDHVLFLDDLFNRLNISREKNSSVVRDLYFISHLILIVSKDEGFGLPVLEAGISRIPIAVSQLSIFREVARDGVLYLPLDESEEYNANRISRFLLTSKSKSSILFQRIFNKYNWETLWENYLQGIFD